MTLAISFDSCIPGNKSTLADIWCGAKRYRQDLPETPFPQANDLEKIVSVIRLASKSRKGTHADAISRALGVTQRQAQYYANAGLFLKSIKKDIHGRYTVTRAGLAIAKARTLRRASILIAKRLLASPSFHDAARIYLETGEAPAAETIADAIQVNRGLGMTEVNYTTAKRRGSTIRSLLQKLDDIL